MNIEGYSRDNTLNLQTGDNPVEPTKAKSSISKVCLLYSQGNLVKNVRRKIVVVSEISPYHVTKAC